jgi:succinate-semialdehyde dehydrogenase/glutarate-semialdehyde dehydrogenase
MYTQPRLFIAGKWLGPTKSAVDIRDPATEEVIGQCPLAGPSEIDAVLTAAAAGHRAWGSRTPWERSAVLRRISNLLRERIETIAQLMTAEVGKPLAEARTEIMSAVEHFDWCADETRRLYDRNWGGRTAGSRLEVRHEPVGVVLALTAWNFPIGLAARKLAMALAAGCAVILRPAEEAPATAAALVEACHDGGLPDGAINLLFGSPEVVVAPLMAAPVVRKVSFTGSTRVGQILMRQGADTLKKLTMELGGHAPVIVLDDVDVAKAAAAAVAGKFRNAGQVCTSPTRFIVGQAIADDFVAAFADGVRQLKIGDGRDPQVQIGPLTTQRQRDHVERLISDAVRSGATVAAGGKRPEGFNRGYFFEPTIVVEPGDGAAILKEEPFGPVAVVQRVSSDAEAIAKANSVDFGLAAYIYGKDTTRIDAIAHALESGVVGVNTNVVALPEGPFGGIKHSGFGREGGFEGVQEYLVAKFIHRA